MSNRAQRTKASVINQLAKPSFVMKEEKLRTSGEWGDEGRWGRWEWRAECVRDELVINAFKGRGIQDDVEGQSPSPERRVAIGEVTCCSADSIADDQSLEAEGRTTMKRVMGRRSRDVMA